MPMYPLSEEAARDFRSLSRNLESRSPDELEALKQTRHAEDPTCQVCKAKIETIGEASLLTNVLYATRGDRTVYAHTKCLGLAFTQIANRAIRMRNCK